MKAAGVKRGTPFEAGSTAILHRKRIDRRLPPDAKDLECGNRPAPAIEAMHHSCSHQPHLVCFRGKPRQRQRFHPGGGQRPSREPPILRTQELSDRLSPQHTLTP
jgi:hypothetical protein